MNAGQETQSLLDKLARFLYSDKPILIHLTDQYKEVYAGISRKIIPGLSLKTGTERKPFLPILVDLDTIWRVRIIKVRWNRSYRYEKIGDKLLPKKMEFNVRSAKLRKSSDGNLRGYMRTDLSKESLMFSSLPIDIDQFRREILEIENTQT